MPIIQCRCAIYAIPLILMNFSLMNILMISILFSCIVYPVFVVNIVITIPVLATGSCYMAGGA